MDITIFIAPFFGGVLIGLSAFLLLFLTGNIAGISGIIRRSFKKELQWEHIFLLGLIISPILVHPWFKHPYELNVPMLNLILGAFLVGLGTTIGSGCTSGHGICGIGRFSMRSIIATCIFMTSAIITVYCTRHLF